MYTVDDCPHVGCKYCKFYKVNAEQAGVESTCKRIDHKVLKFAKPWFAVYDCGAWHIPCRDFVPKYPEYADFKAWTNFDDFWPVFVKAWLPYENEDITVDFTLNGNDKVRYYVPLKLSGRL